MNHAPLGTSVVRGWISSPEMLKIFAVAWVVVGAAMIVVGMLVWFRPVTAGPYLAVALIASLVLSVLTLWSSVIGAIIDVVLLVALAWWSRRR